MNLLNRILHFFKNPDKTVNRLQRVAAKHKTHTYLTPDQVGAVKILIAEGIPTRDIAGAFNISRPTVSRIRTGKHPYCVDTPYRKKL